MPLQPFTDPVCPAELFNNAQVVTIGRCDTATHMPCYPEIPKICIVWLSRLSHLSRHVLGRPVQARAMLNYAGDAGNGITQDAAARRCCGGGRFDRRTRYVICVYVFVR